MYVKSTLQSQISSLTASLSGKEAQVESLVQAVSDAERRVGEAQEKLRDEHSAREYAEFQMVDWKNKGEEVQKPLQERVGRPSGLSNLYLPSRTQDPSVAGRLPRLFRMMPRGKDIPSRPMERPPLQPLLVHRLHDASHSS